jgi:hypothetical protein
MTIASVVMGLLVTHVGRLANAAARLRSSAAASAKCVYRARHRCQDPPRRGRGDGGRGIERQRRASQGTEPLALAPEAFGAHQGGRREVAEVAEATAITVD